MREKTNVLTYNNGEHNPKTKFISYKCNKCGSLGFFAVELAVEDLTDEQKKCCDVS